MSVTALSDLVTGPVIGPADPGYEDARHVYNFMIEARPHAIVQCASANDVRAAVAHAAATGRDVAVRGGGHSVPGFGTADDAIVVDLSGMTRIEVDPKTQIARVGGGATWAMMNDATTAHGLATTGGIVSSTGVGGLTLGGGVGYLTRAHGLSCDNLLSAEVILADASIVTASEDEHPDLFWALRGGGGNFGVVTEFTFRLHPVPENIYGGLILFEREAAGDLFRYFDRFIDDAPREYGGFPAWHLAPPLPFIPEDRVGEPFPALVSCWTGDHDSGAKILHAFRDVGPVMAEHGRHDPLYGAELPVRPAAPARPAALLEGGLRGRPQRRRDRRARRVRPADARRQLRGALVPGQRRRLRRRTWRHRVGAPRRQVRHRDRRDVAGPCG